MAQVTLPHGDGSIVLDTVSNVATRRDAAGNVLATRTLTPVELKRFEEQRARNEAALVASTNEAKVKDALRDHMAALNTIIGSSGALTLAQLSNAVRVLAQGQKRLIRLEVDALDATD